MMSFRPSPPLLLFVYLFPLRVFLTTLFFSLYATYPMPYFPHTIEVLGRNFVPKPFPPPPRLSSSQLLSFSPPFPFCSLDFSLSSGFFKQFCQPHVQPPKWSFPFLSVSFFFRTPAADWVVKRRFKFPLRS